jgi:hypothetical protein
MATTSTASVEKPSRIAISEILRMKNAPLVFVSRPLSPPQLPDGHARALLDAYLIL